MTDRGRVTLSDHTFKIRSDQAAAESHRHRFRGLRRQSAGASQRELNEAEKALLKRRFDAEALSARLFRSRRATANAHRAAKMAMG
jgi:hypothetical protein